MSKQEMMVKASNGRCQVIGVGQLWHLTPTDERFLIKEVGLPNDEFLVKKIKSGEDDTARGWTHDLKLCEIQPGHYRQQEGGDSPFRYKLVECSWKLGSWWWSYYAIDGVHPNQLGGCSESDIIEYTTATAPAPTRASNFKCYCGSDAFNFFNVVECFNSECRLYKPDPEAQKKRAIIDNIF